MQHIIDGARQKYAKLKETDEKSFATVSECVFLGTFRIKVLETHACNYACILESDECFV